MASCKIFMQDFHADFHARFSCKIFMQRKLPRGKNVQRFRRSPRRAGGNVRIRRCADDKHHRGICTLLGVWVAGVAIPYVSWLDATRTSPSRKVERKMLPPGCWLPATRNLPRQTTGHHQGGRREQTPGVLEENCQIRQTHRVHLTTGVPSPRDDKTQRSTHPRNHVTKTYPTGGSLEFEAPASIFFGRHGNAPH